ncbi:MAG: type II toxin-antitoxin system VapC family toxin [Acidobacteria bacterium]|nr:type II toxin-antitoxin system VapC family toxin [Acidobacteriota bacterium]
MNIVFVDTFYLIALANPRDEWHEKAKAVGDSLGKSLQLTTESVLTEFLNFFCKSGPFMRQAVVEMVDAVSQTTKVISQNHELFLCGLELYRSRLDKGYSLTDCISMVVMQEYNITDVLTHDKHFAQEGFRVLIT